MRASLPYLLSTIFCFTAATLQSQAHAMQLSSEPPEQRAAKEVTCIFPLKHLDADTALQIFRALYESDARLKVEPQSNSLVFRGSVSDQEKIVALLGDLDSNASQSKPAVPAGTQALSIAAKSGDQPVAELRQQYRKLDQQCLELAERLRSKPEVDKSSKQSLAEQVERVFDARQQLQRAEIAENVRRLVKIQQTIESREGLKTQIVQRRVEELLNPDVDWQKKELTAEDQTAAGARQADPNQFSQDLSVGRLSQAANPLTAPDLLQTSPNQMRELLRGGAEGVIVARRNIDNLRSKIQKDGNAESLIAELSDKESSLKYYESQFQFAKMQFDETVKYLALTVEYVGLQLASAQEEYDRTRVLYERKSASMSQVNSAAVRPRELQVELQRLESLLKLYQAAGDIPEVNEIGKSSDARLTIMFKDSKLGLPKWINGNCGLTTGSGGFWIGAGTQPGTFGVVLFEKIPGHENRPLLMTFEVPKSAEETIKKQERGGAWQIAIEAKFSEEDIQAALEGKLKQKLFVLNPDLTVAEKWSVGESIDSKEEAVIATFKLTPAPADEAVRP